MCGTFEAAIPPKPGANQNFGLGDESRRNRAGVWRKGRVVECFSSMRAWRFGALVCRFVGFDLLYVGGFNLSNSGV